MRNKIYMAINNISAKTFPYIDRWIGEQGWIEMGSDENSDSLVRAIDEGGLVWEAMINIKQLMMRYWCWSNF